MAGERLGGNSELEGVRLQATYGKWHMGTPESAPAIAGGPARICLPVEVAVYRIAQASPEARPSPTPTSSKQAHSGTYVLYVGWVEEWEEWATALEWMAGTTVGC